MSVPSAAVKVGTRDLLGEGHQAPMRAMRPEHGRIDATAQGLGCDWSWSAIHRVQPRAPLTCPECGHGLRTKVSRRGPSRPRMASALSSSDSQVLERRGTHKHGARDPCTPSNRPLGSRP